LYTVKLDRRFDKTKDEVALFICFPVDHFLLYVSKKCIIKNGCEKQKHPQRVEKWRSGEALTTTD
jgi:hypothetical protein